MHADEVLALLEEQPIFAALDRPALTEFAEIAELHNLPGGRNACEEGDIGDAAYLVYSGRLRVLKAGRDGQSVTLATLTRGDIFGEFAVIAGEPRNATVRTVEDSTLLRFERRPFLEFLSRHPEFQEYFQRLIDERAIATFLQSSTVLKSVPPAQLRDLVNRMHAVTFAAGEAILIQGDPGDCLYILQNGEAKAVQRDEDGEKVLTFYGAGEHFGERALITGEMCVASILAVRETACLALDKADFDAVIARAPALKATLQKIVDDGILQPDDAARHRPKAESAPERHSPDYQAADASAAKQEPGIRPRSGFFHRYPWIRQYDETDCAAASLGMISRYYGRRLPLARLRDLANVDREGASMFSLAAAAEVIGYASRAVKCNYAALLTLELPAVAHWKGYHYVVVYKADDSRVVVADPAVGLLRMTREEFEKGWTGRLLLLQPTPTLLQQEEQKSTIARFVPLLKPYRKLLIEVLFASLLINVFGLATPIFTQTIIDKVLVHQDVSMLNVMLGGMLIIGVFTTLTVLLRHYLLIHISQKLSLRLASDLFRQIMRLPMAYFGKRKVGDILTRFADNRKVQELITSDALNTLLDLLMVVVYLSVMFVYNAELAAVALIFIPASVLVTVAFTPAMKRNNQALFEKIAVTQSKLIESIEKVEAIKTATAEMTTRWRYEDLIVQRANQGFRGAKLGMVMGALSSAIQLLSSTVVLWYGAHLMIDGEMTVGQLIAFNTLIGMVMAPILGLVGMWQRLQDAFLSLQRLSDIYDAEPEEAEGIEKTLVHLPPLQGQINFESVSFSYGSDTGNVLSEIDLEIQPGQRIALVGRSGSGKSTLISLLQRLQRATEGRILVDGHDIAVVSGRSLRSQFGVVMQDSSIFTGTIRENIALSQPEAAIERVIAAAKLAAAHDFITSFPLGYDTVIGEIGISLSGGQRQRICIARALINDPRVILFDEATSSLDTESERAIQKNMETMLRGRTALIIAHRLSTIRTADVIVVLDEGRIVESGSHAALLEQRGLYHYFHSQQLGE